jgi:hypothetical protein
VPARGQLVGFVHAAVVASWPAEDLAMDRGMLSDLTSRPDAAVIAVRLGAHAASYPISGASRPRPGMKTTVDGGF